MSISITIATGDLGTDLRRLTRMLDLDEVELMTDIGQAGVTQTQERIDFTKTAPDGTAWVPNIEGNSILLKTGQHLAGSLAFTASASETEWGSSWEWAHVHQEGMVIKPKAAKALMFLLGGKMVAAKQVTIPARPFLGLSDDNKDEIKALVTDHFRMLP